MAKKLTILGCGRWATYLAYIYEQAGWQVMIWGLSKDLQKLSQTRTYVRGDFRLVLPASIKLEEDLVKALKFGNLVFMVIRAKAVGEFVKVLAKTATNWAVKDMVLCMKGLDASGQRLSEVVGKSLKLRTLAVLFGPAHGEEIISQKHEALLVLSLAKRAKLASQSIAQNLAKKLSNKMLYVTYSEDLVGTEYGGVFKNIAGLVCGLLTGLGREDLVGPFIAYYLQEVKFFIKQLGGRPQTADGLAFLGELKTTMLSSLSKNFSEGFDYIISDGVSFPSSGEGINSIKAMKLFARDKKLAKQQYPVLATVNKIFYQQKKFSREFILHELKALILVKLPKIYKF